MKVFCKKAIYEWKVQATKVSKTLCHRKTEIEGGEFLIPHSGKRISGNVSGKILKVQYLGRYLNLILQVPTLQKHCLAYPPAYIKITCGNLNMQDVRRFHEGFCSPKNKIEQESSIS